MSKKRTKKKKKRKRKKNGEKKRVTQQAPCRTLFECKQIEYK